MKTIEIDEKITRQLLVVQKEINDLRDIKKQHDKMMAKLEKLSCQHKVKSNAKDPCFDYLEGFDWGVEHMQNMIKEILDDTQ